MRTKGGRTNLQTSEQQGDGACTRGSLKPPRHPAFQAPKVDLDSENIESSYNGVSWHSATGDLALAESAESLAPATMCGNVKFAESRNQDSAVSLIRREWDHLSFHFIIDWPKCRRQGQY